MRVEKSKLIRALENEPGVIKTKNNQESPFILTTGKQSKYFMDMKLATLNPEITKLMVEAILTDTTYFARDGNKILNKFGFTKIAAVAVGAVMLGEALSLATGLHLIVVRTTKFDLNSPSPVHTAGTSKNVIGECKGQTILLLDDVATTGDSVVKAVQNLRLEGGFCNHALIIVDRDEGAKTLCYKNKIELNSLLRRQDLL